MALLGDPRVWHAAWVTLYFTGLALGLELLLGLGIALYLNREFAGSGLVRTVLLPAISGTPVAIALVWAMMFNPTLGMLNYLLSLVGLPPLLWASDPVTAVPSSSSWTSGSGPRWSCCCSSPASRPSPPRSWKRPRSTARSASAWSDAFSSP